MRCVECLLAAWSGALSVDPNGLREVCLLVICIIHAAALTSRDSVPFVGVSDLVLIVAVFDRAESA